MDVVRVRAKNLPSDMDVNPPPWQLLARTRTTSIFKYDFIGNMRYVVPYTLKGNQVRWGTGRNERERFALNNLIHLLVRREFIETDISRDSLARCRRRKEGMGVTN